MEHLSCRLRLRMRRDRPRACTSVFAGLAAQGTRHCNLPGVVAIITRSRPQIRPGPRIADVGLQQFAQTFTTIRRTCASPSAASASTKPGASRATRALVLRWRSQSSLEGRAQEPSPSWWALRSCLDIPCGSKKRGACRTGLAAMPKPTALGFQRNGSDCRSDRASLWLI